MAACCGHAALAAPLMVIRPADEAGDDERAHYSWSLLEAALKATDRDFGPHELKAFGGTRNVVRTLLDLESGASPVNVLVHGNVRDYEDRLLAIRFPLDRGLLGYRVFLIRADRQREFDRINNLDDLRRYSIGQGRGWIDVQILRLAGLNVIEGGGYVGLFKMLAAGRFDLFSRSVIEVGDELLKHQTQPPMLAIEHHLLLHYPFTHYFYVRRSPAGEALAQRIFTGLTRIQSNGNFDDIFAWYLAQIEKPLGLRQRLLINIDNPLQMAGPAGDDAALGYNRVSP